MYDKEADWEIPASTKMLVKITGKKAEQGNSIIVTKPANRITVPSNKNQLVLFLNIDSILGLSLDNMLLELQMGPLL